MAAPASGAETHVARGASRSGHVTFHCVIHDHAVGVEAPSERANCALHALDPAAGQSVAVTVIVKRDNHLAQGAIQILAVAGVMYTHLGVGSPDSDRETV